MLYVKTPEEALSIIEETFGNIKPASKRVPLGHALGKILASDIVSDEYVPDFHPLHSGRLCCFCPRYFRLLGEHSCNFAAYRRGPDG